MSNLRRSSSISLSRWRQMSNCADRPSARPCGQPCSPVSGGGDRLGETNGAYVGQVAGPLTPYYERDGIVIYHGDCRDVLPLLDAVDLVLTDPPYNSGQPYGLHNDRMPPDEYEAWCRSWWAPVRKASRRVILFP